jgi:hypothetical protein
MRLLLPITPSEWPNALLKPVIFRLFNFLFASFQQGFFIRRETLHLSVKPIAYVETIL